MDDDIEFDSNSEHEYAASSRRRLGKRPVREVEDFEDFEDNEDIDHYDRREGRGNSGSGGSSERIRVGASSTTTTTSNSRREQEDDEQQQEDGDKPTFRPETMQAIFKAVWTEPGIKCQKEALQLSAEYLRLFTIEALHRTAAYQREQEDEDLRDEETLIELDSLEAITPQLIMDF